MVLEDLFRRPSALVRFRLPPVGPMMNGFCEWLRRQGFSRSGMRRRAWQLSHFNGFLRGQGVKDAHGVERTHAERFISKHLPRCRCGGRSGCKHVGAPSSVRSFLDYLGESGLLAPCAPSSPPYDGVLEKYLDYLKCERNLAGHTLRAHRQCVSDFLDDLGAPVVARLGQLSPEQVLAFFAKYGQNRGPNLRRRVQGVLRSFLRFCVRQGYLERDLAEVVPPLRTYKLSGVPRAISEEDAQKALHRIDRTTCAGRRDYAILQLLYTYGVRSGQVRALQLDDVQWRENQIRFRAHKGGKQLIHPLFDEVGESLLDYLRFGRPQAPYPEVFLTTHAPIRPLRSASAVSKMVSQRMHQAGVNKPKASCHAFRHAFAARMLQQGQTLKTIADLLGHRNINTTFIYTKVDFRTLQLAPLDWPEVAS